jgi:hypothetical protein
MDIKAIVGTFEGSGTWHDSAAKSMGYRVRQINRISADGFEVKFKHDFDDGTTTDAWFVMTWIAPHLFRVDVGSNAVGHGYCVGNSCSFHIKPGEAFVQVSYRPNGNALEVEGSSTKNSEGNYIAWQERLERVEAKDMEERKL